MADEQIDYKAVGLKSGIEIHQQLDTHKLFCNCPSEIRDDEPDLLITRKLRAVRGETGETDIAAKSETKRDKTFVYQGYKDTNCPVEFDEEPPKNMNGDALNVVLQVSKMLNANLIDEVQVMRKTVVNGSNTSGFQRTSLVSHDGNIETQDGKVGIESVCIEEDSAKDVEKHPDYTVYNLSRLGVPLIEIATAPDIKTANQCREVCEHIGMILRSTGKVKRGIGTIRQDINISIKGGARIEIKGAQDLKTIPLWIDNEIIRQQSLIALKDKIPQNDVYSEIVDVGEVFEKSESKVIRKALDNNGNVLAVKLEGYLGLTGLEIQPGRRVGSELSDYAKIAGGVGGLFHTDELPKYGITQEDVDKIKRVLNCKENDAFILVADKLEKCKLALHAVIDRANRFKEGVLMEVRKPNPDGTSSFMRPIPGKDRMYPETDCVPIKVSYDDVKLPELINDKIDRYVDEFKLSKDLATKIIREVPNFEDIVKMFENLKAAYVGETLIGVNKLINKKYKLELNLSQDIILDVLTYLNKGEIVVDSVIEILKENKPIESIIDKYKMMSEGDLEKLVVEILNNNKDKNPKAMVGIVMGQLRGKGDPKKIIELVNKNTQ